MNERREGQPAPARRKPPRNRRRRPATTGRRADLWRPVPAPPAPAPIVPVPDPTALIDSLGSPPLQGQPAATQYLATVVERAAALATALAASAGLLGEADTD
jgi:hypothetical protein